LTQKELDTRERILKVASDLFAKNGFNGTSVRDLAKNANVNLSAINYHFSNKENLYFEVFKFNHTWLADSINQIGEDESLDLREFTWRVYSYFLENGDALMNTFKIFLADDLELPQDTFGEDQNFGPPGSEAFLKVITRDVEDIPFWGRHWAMRMIFGNIVHFGVSMNTSFMKEKCAQHPYLGPDEKKKSLYQLVEAILNYLKENHQQWEDVK
jgi:AcrR family transcriptional regulator